jgi:hypothetical protein
VLQTLLQRRKVSDRVDLAVADDHVGFAGDYRRNELFDVGTVVLVVSVGVDDDVSAKLERGIKACLEPCCKPFVRCEPNDVVNAAGSSDLDCAVFGAIVDHEPFDRVDTWNLPWKIAQSLGEGFLLVVTGDLDY